MLLIKKLHKYFKNKFNLSEPDSIKVKYSLEIIIGDLSKFIILFILFLMLGKINDFIYSTLTLLTIRLFTGGLHFSTYKGCIIFSSIFFYTSIFLKNYVVLNKFILITLFAFSILTVITLAPICGNSRPDYSYKKIRQFKLISVITICIHFLIYVFTHKNPYIINSIWVITLQSLQMLVGKGVQVYAKKVNHKKTI